MVMKGKNWFIIGLSIIFLIIAGFGCQNSWREPETRMKFVWIPGGCFQMGSPADEKGRESDEGPVHKVCVDGFWIGKYEVTNAQFRQFKAEHKINRTPTGQPLNNDNQPAVLVSWNDAEMFAKWLTEQNKGKYTFRLPTEAEWEYACRGGKSEPVYDDEDICQYANVHDKRSKSLNMFHWKHYKCDDSYGATAPVGSFEPNDFEVFDMLGNASEWCEDEYSKEAYSKHQQKNPLFRNKVRNKTSGNPKPASVRKTKASIRAVRGGNWRTGPNHVRYADRDLYSSIAGKKSIGFRLVRTSK
ncbi:MAG: formylglycine-generating enzyme family protein [Desulfobacteraceae bacterium]|nr:formylglycine-generating enzyme family protein [Desulfobacteraceae bacterium]